MAAALPDPARMAEVAALLYDFDPGVKGAKGKLSKLRLEHGQFLLGFIVQVLNALPKEPPASLAEQPL